MNRESIFSKPSTGRNLAILIATCSVVPLASAASESWQCVAHSTNSSKFSNLPPEIEPLVDEMIFSESFDAQSDWRVEQSGRCQSGDDCDGPANWDWYYSAEKWHPDNPAYPTHHASIEISSDVARGGTGKSMITYDESYGSKSQWGSDAQLGKDLSGDYPDIYVEFWVKYQPGYRWEIVEEGFGINSTKTSRVSSFTGSSSDSRFKFFSGTVSAPFFISQFKTEIGRSGRGELTSVGGTTRCTPSDTNYQCTDSSNPTNTGYNGKLGDYVPFVQNLGDGQWHKWAYRAKYNSAPGVHDGETYVWVDDVLIAKNVDVAFIGVNDTNPPSGFNTFLLGGNINNIPADESEAYEQWLAFDDVRIFSLK